MGILKRRYERYVDTIEFTLKFTELLQEIKAHIFSFILKKPPADFMSEDLEYLFCGEGHRRHKIISMRRQKT